MPIPTAISEALPFDGTGAQPASGQFPQVGAGALVIGGAHGSLGVIRSLGRHGIPVWYLGPSQSVAGYSRFVRKRVEWPGPEDPRALDFLTALAWRYDLRGWVLLPGGDADARFISIHHAELSKHFRVTTPPWETLQFAADKHRTYELAARIGVDCPWTFKPRNRADVENLDCRFPVILKPDSRNSTNAFTQAKAWRVDDRASLLVRYDEAVSLVGVESVLIQELIPGNGACQFSFAAVCENGVPFGSLIAQRRRQYPIDFGLTSTFVESIDEPLVEDFARRFLTATRYNGLVELEFKYDSRDKRYKLLDVNARTWAWLSLGHKAGVDFPWLLWQLTMGNTVQPVRGRSGCAWAHVSRDLAAALAEIRAGSLTLGEYLRSFRASLEFAAFSADDPLPGLLDFPLTMTRVFLRYTQRVP